MRPDRLMGDMFQQDRFSMGSEILRRVNVASKPEILCSESDGAHLTANKGAARRTTTVA